MKKIAFTSFISIFSFFSAQDNVGIGTTTPNSSAALDIDVSSLPTNGKKGVLLPKVSLLNNTDVVTIPNPARGLMVYNLANNGTGTSAVYKDNFYFWDGVKWVDSSNLDTVKQHLLPQIFFLKNTSAQSTMSSSPTIVNGIVVDYQGSEILLNTGGHVTLNTNNTFTLGSAGRYEISGNLNYNPDLSWNSSTNVEFIIQTSSDNGSTWNEVAKSTGFWGNWTGTNSRSVIITPQVITVAAGNLIRCVALSTYGSQGSTARMSTPSGLFYSKTLKIQYLN